MWTNRRTARPEATPVLPRLASTSDQIRRTRPIRQTRRIRQTRPTTARSMSRTFMAWAAQADVLRLVPPSRFASTLATSTSRTAACVAARDNPVADQHQDEHASEEPVIWTARFFRPARATTTAPPIRRLTAAFHHRTCKPTAAAVSCAHPGGTAGLNAPAGTLWRQGGHHVERRDCVRTARRPGCRSTSSPDASSASNVRQCCCTVR